MPAVGELSIVSILVESPEKDLVRVTVLQVDQLAQTSQEGGVAVRAIFIGQNGNLVVNLRRDRTKELIIHAGLEIKSAIGMFSPDRRQQTPLQFYGCHKEASGPEPSQLDRSPAAGSARH